jgi:hypothetical protein
MAHILVHTGHSPKELARQFTEICSAWKEPAQGGKPPDINFLTGLTEIIARWHAESEFLDSRGAPLALPLRAGHPSLGSLIKRVLPHADPRVVVQSLIEIRGVRRVGNRFSPTDRQLRFTQQNARIYGLQALRGLLRTIEYNVTRAPAGSTIQERVAVSPYFPAHALGAFHRWLRAHAKDWLWKTHCYMDRRGSRKQSGATTRLCVAVFAFEDPMITGTSMSTDRSSARTQKSPVGAMSSTQRGRVVKS